MADRLRFLDAEQRHVSSLLRASEGSSGGDHA
jgi:hypothetical protein